MYAIYDDLAFNELKQMILEGEGKITSSQNSIVDLRLKNGKVIKIEMDKKYFNLLNDETNINRLMYGKDKTERIVNISVVNEQVYIFKQNENGEITSEIRDFHHWVLSPNKKSGSKELKGPGYYKYINLFSNKEFNDIKKYLYNSDIYTIFNPVENYMVLNGLTYFKGMKSDEINMLSFDIETSGLDPSAPDAYVYLITNTFRNHKGELTKKTFICDDFDSQLEMIQTWCEWVEEKNPALIVGHNIVIFDIPYLNYIYNSNKNGFSLPLGRGLKEIQIAKKPSELRKDGTQSYTYHKLNLFGREIIDTFFLAIKADIARKYESYGLKSIIRQEGLEKEDRQMYDASKIKDNWSIPEERKKIIAYAEDDSDDPIKLYDLMIAPFFYFTNHIPKPFQMMIESATGSQLNALMVRSYLQDGFSVAKADMPIRYEGAISFGNFGKYKYVHKVDVKSLYPSIMLHYKISPGKKDFNNNFLKMLNYFTEERLKNKELAERTGERFYSDLEQMEKVGINSGYGFLGASGLNYNNFHSAAEVTRYGREILSTAIDWAKNKGFTIPNGDTDSISYTANRHLEKEEREMLLNELNSLYPKGITFADDGYFDVMIISKAKNYVLLPSKEIAKEKDLDEQGNVKIKLKGSSLKDQKKEKVLKQLLNDCIYALVYDKDDEIPDIYKKYVKMAFDVSDISIWASKKTVTKAVLNCEKDEESRKNEMVIYDAIKHIHTQEGDKVWLYPCIINEEKIETPLKNGKVRIKIIKQTGLRLIDEWKGDHDSEKLLDRVYNTMKILENVIDMDKIINFNLKKNQSQLEELLSGKSA